MIKDIRNGLIACVLLYGGVLFSNETTGIDLKQEVLPGTTHIDINQKNGDVLFSNETTGVDLKQKVLPDTTHIDINQKTLAVPEVATTSASNDPLPKEKRILYLKALGHLLCHNQGLLNLGLEPKEELEWVIEGIRAAVNGEELPIKIPEDFEDMQKFFMSKEQEQLENTKKLAETFLKAKESESGIQKTASGLLYKIIKPGDAVRADNDCTVEVDYEGKLIDGKIFDSTFNRDEKGKFYLGNLVPGVREAITLIGNGGEIQAFIPSHLAYGDSSAGPIPGGSTLEFTIKVHTITRPRIDQSSENQLELNKAQESIKSTVDHQQTPNKNDSLKPEAKYEVELPATQPEVKNTP